MPNCDTLTAQSSPAITAKEYGYDAGATTTIVYYDSQVFANSKATATAPLVACPILNCVLLQTDCTTALVAPFDTKLTIDAASPWNLRISQDQVSGYPNVAVCYKCNNGYGTYNQHTITQQVTIRQKIDCTIALNANSTSLIKNYKTTYAVGVATVDAAELPAIAYNVASEYKVLTEYDAVDVKMFGNINNVDCGLYTGCEVLPVGCTGAYTGRAKITAVTFGLEAVQNTDAGYTETLCVKCVNAAGSST